MKGNATMSRIRYFEASNQGCPDMRRNSSGDSDRDSMNVAIVYDSRTGTTASAAVAMAEELKSHGHECHVRSIAEADPTMCAQADLICVGSWTQGLFLFLQHPTKQAMRFIKRLGNLQGKKAVVFCTYKIATGSLLAHMAGPLQEKGAKVIGQFKFRGPKPGTEFASFVRTLT